MSENKRKVDLQDSSKGKVRLLEAKAEEKRHNRKLKRVDILNGYVLTTNKSKWNSHRINVNQNGSIKKLDRKDYTPLKSSG